MRNFRLTESVCDQAVLVNAKLHGWSEWFSNPTAGPWKRIVMPGISSLAQTGFEKEETRPDLILYHDTPDKKILIIESKDNIQKIITPSNHNQQIIKTCDVFLNIKNRLDEILKTSTKKDISSDTKSLNYIPGYVVGYSDDLSLKIPELKKLHFKYVNKSVFPYFLLIIVKKSNYDITITTKVISLDSNEQISKLQKFFQTGI